LAGFEQEAATTAAAIAKRVKNFFIGY